MRGREREEVFVLFSLTLYNETLSANMLGLSGSSLLDFNCSFSVAALTVDRLVHNDLAPSHLSTPSDSMFVQGMIRL